MESETSKTFLSILQESGRSNTGIPIRDDLINELNSLRQGKLTLGKFTTEILKQMLKEIKEHYNISSQ